MKKFMIVLPRGYYPSKDSKSVWVYYPETDDDGTSAREIQDLVKSLKTAEIISDGKTGMFVIDEFEIYGRCILVVSIREKVVLDSTELEIIKQECEFLLKKIHR